MVLTEGEEHRWRGIFGQKLVFAIFNDPDNLIIGLVAAEKVTANCRLIAEHLLSKSLIHNCDMRRLRPIVPGEIPAREQRGGGGLQISRRDPVTVRTHHAV